MMIPVMIATTGASLLACGLLVLAEYRAWALCRIVAKSSASALFIVVGALAIMTCNGVPDRWQTLILVGLVLGALGDVALLRSSERAFLAGLAVFLLGHVAYVLACMDLVPVGDWLSIAGPLAIGPCVVGIAALAWLWPRLGSMKIPVLAYVVTIVAMVIGALAALRADEIPAHSRQLLAIGAVLFFASDLAVARDRFVSHDVINRAWGLPAYYVGQLLIAWSIRCA